MAKAGGRGFCFEGQGEAPNTDEFADDLSINAESTSACQQTGQVGVSGCGFSGVRINALKSYYVWSPAAERKRVPKPIRFRELDAAGRWCTQTVTPVCAAAR